MFLFLKFLNQKQQMQLQQIESILIEPLIVPLTLILPDPSTAKSGDVKLP